jgi:hypothetical protein
MSELFIGVTVAVTGTLLFAFIVLFAVFIVWLVKRPPRCTGSDHHWESWQIGKVVSDRYSRVKAYQHRVCKICGYTQMRCNSVD